MKLFQDYYEQNLFLLQTRHPEAWKVVMDYTGKPVGEFLLAENKKINLLVRDENGEEILLHDAKDPEAELESYYALVPENALGAVVFVGMGLGYSPLAMIQNRKQIRHLVILEPEVGIFIQALHALDLEKLLTERRVCFAIGPDINVEEVTFSIQRALLLESVHILNHLPTVRINPKVYQDLYDEVYKKSNASNVGGSTISTFGQKFIENRFRHLSSIHHQRLLEHLNGSFEGVPAIIVAGGPSLNKNIHHLVAAKGRSVIIAADTVLPALLKHGVVPDFTASIDMQDIVMEKIIDVSAAARETSLVCAAWVNPTIPKKFPAKQVYWTFSGKNMEAWLSRLLGGNILTCGAGTVAHLSFTTAVMLGCSPVIFVGQDLAFTGMQDHVQGASLSTRNELAKLSASKEMQWVEGYGGEKVPTTRGWLSDKHHFEWMIENDPNRKFVNATEGGVRIEGTEELSLQDTLEKFCTEKIQVQEVIREAEGKSEMVDRRRMIDEFGRLLKQIDKVEKDMRRLDSITKTLPKEISRLQKQNARYTHFETLPTSVKRLVLSLDELNSRLDGVGIWATLDEITMSGLRESERCMHEVKDLEGKPKHYLKYVLKSVERFVLINECRKKVLALFKRQLACIRGPLMRESQLLQSKERKGAAGGEIILELLRQYFQGGNFVLMEKTIAAVCQDPENSAELSFYLGVIASHQCRLDDAEAHFAQTLALDSSWATAINDCRRGLGDQYLEYYRDWKINDEIVAVRMLFKGIRHCPDHSEVNRMLGEEAEQVLIDASTAAEKGDLVVVMEAKVAFWCRGLDENGELLASIGNEKAASLYRFDGNIGVARQEYAQAAQSFAAAITLTPQAPDLHLHLADCAFATGDYVAGVASLDQAVAIDCRYASYWENMGDNLFSSGKPEDAIHAYERCLLALPEHFVLFKKIGDCYMASDQPVAALEAYRNFKCKMEGGDVGFNNEVISG